MNLTEKDHDFLRRAKPLLDDGTFRVRAWPGRLQLCGNYGDAIHVHFGMSRQGVRWRFQRIAAMYRHAFATILTVESVLGSQLRDAVIAQVRGNDLNDTRRINATRLRSDPSGGEPREDGDQG